MTRFFPLLHLFVFLIAGCAGNQVPVGPPVSPARNGATAATVTIYRQRAILGIAVHPTMMLNGRELVGVPNGRAFKLRLDPGKYSFNLEDEASGADLDLKPGQQYFMRVDIVPGIFVGSGKMTVVAPEQGAYETRDLPPPPQDEVKNSAFKTGS